MKKTSVFVLTTGGTIEKSYDEFEGSLTNKKSLIEEFVLDRLRLPYTEILIKEVMAKDSLFMGDQDRQRILDKIKSIMDLGRPILIIHGTDTMADTADYCSKHLSEPPVPIIFTGAMRPLGFEDSDGRQNFTESLMAAQLAPAGFYICFHNRLHKVPGTQKLRELGTFHSNTK